MFQNRIKTLALIVLCMALGFYIYDNQKNGGKDAISQSGTPFTEAGGKISYSYDNTISFYATNDGSFFMCTKDGIKYMNAEGKSVWEDVFTFAAPIMVGEGSYAAVSEPESSVVHVFGPKGKLYSKPFEGNIMHYSVNNSGYCSVLIKKNEDYERQVFDPAGTCIDNFMHADVNLFPICSDVSNDGRMVAVGLLDINNISITSHISMAYLKKEEQKGVTDGIFKSVPIDKQLVIASHFMSNNNLISFLDSAMHFIDLSAETDLNADKITPVNNKLDFINMFGENGFLLAYGEPSAGKEGAPAGRVEFYNYSGEKVSEFDVNKTVTYVHTTDKYALVGANRTFYAFNSSGKLLWEHTFTQDYKQIIFLGKPDTLLFATNIEAVIMKRGN